MKIPVRLIRFSLFLCLLTGCTEAPTPTQEATSSPSPEPKSTATIPATTAPQIELQAGQWTFLFYHPTFQKVILVNGGPDRGKPASDPLELWSWDGKSWSLVSADPDGPAWRNFAGAAFDTKRNRLILHGGVQDQNSRMEETWEWDGAIWTRFDVPGPSYREGAMMAYDEARGVSVLYGGANETFELFGDTWTWDGTQWTQVSTTGPQPRFPSTLVYDSAREKVLLFSGHFVDNTSYIDYEDFWEWDGVQWDEIVVEGEKPGARNIAQLVFDPLTNHVLLFGGGQEEFLSDLWSWDGTIWTHIITSDGPTRSGAGAAYDLERQRLVLFGGVDKPGGKAITDTWEWDGQRWDCVQGCT